jgi:hypothetical protein
MGPLGLIEPGGHASAQRLEAQRREVARCSTGRGFVQLRSAGR